MVHVKKKKKLKKKKSPIPTPEGKDVSSSGWEEFHNQRHRRANIQRMLREHQAAVNRIWDTCIRSTQIKHILSPEKMLKELG